jgi:hypothetical protein
MDKKIIWGLVIFGFLLTGHKAFALRPAGQADAEQKELEAYLKKANVGTILKGAQGGRGEAWTINLHDGKTGRRGFFKYVDIRRPTNFPISYKYELAAYELTKLLKINIVPPVIEREIQEPKGQKQEPKGQKRKGSLQIYVEGCIRESDRMLKKIDPPNPQAFADALEEINVLEILTSCDHLSPKDILIHRETWRVCRVDFAEAFDPSTEFLPEAAIRRCSRRLYKGLLDLSPLDVEATLKPYLNAREIKGLLDRRNLILEKLKDLIKDKGENAVLFDLESK